MKRCSRCLLPETYPNIRYNEDGVCNYCLSYTPIEYKGEEKLEELLGFYRDRGAKYDYDCVVGVSGGRDSTFTLYELVKRYNMRVLAYNYDNGFVSEEAKENVKAITEALGVELVTIKYDQTRYFRNNLKALLKKFSPAMVPTLCLGCRYGIVSGACKIAMKYKVPLVFFSSSRLEKTQFKNEFFKKGNAVFNNRIMGMASEFFTNPSYFKPSFLTMYIRDYFHDDSHLHPLSPVLRLMYGKVKIVEFFDYIRWDEKRIEHTIEKQLNWKKPEEVKSSWRFDCMVHFFKDYFYLNSVGFTELDDLLSNMIREGMIERDVALKRLFDEYDSKMKSLGYTIMEIGKEIGLDGSLLEKIKNFRAG